jgi:hypothetical protein
VNEVNAKKIGVPPSSNCEMAIIVSKGVVSIGFADIDLVDAVKREHLDGSKQLLGSDQYGDEETEDAAEPSHSE